MSASSSYEGTGSASSWVSSSSHEDGSHQKSRHLGKRKARASMQLVSPKDRKPSEESTSLFHAEFNRVSFIFLNFKLMLRGELYACSFLWLSTPLLQLLPLTNIPGHLALSVRKLTVPWPLPSPGHPFLQEELTSVTVCPRWVPFPYTEWCQCTVWLHAPLYTELHWTVQHLADIIKEKADDVWVHHSHLLPTSLYLMPMIKESSRWEATSGGL